MLIPGDSRVYVAKSSDFEATLHRSVIKVMDNYHLSIRSQEALTTGDSIAHLCRQGNQATFHQPHLLSHLHVKATGDCGGTRDRADLK